MKMEDLMTWDRAQLEHRLEDGLDMLFCLRSSNQDMPDIMHEVITLRLQHGIRPAVLAMASFVASQVNTQEWSVLEAANLYREAGQKAGPRWRRRGNFLISQSRRIAEWTVWGIGTPEFNTFVERQDHWPVFVHDTEHPRELLFLANSLLRWVYAYANAIESGDTTGEKIGFKMAGQILMDTTEQFAKWEKDRLRKRRCR
jgi:hypothetical protein